MKRIIVCAVLVVLFFMPHRVRAQAAPPTNPNPSPATLAKYDRNRNGVLDPEELAAKQADDDAAKNGTVTLSPFEVVKGANPLLFGASGAAGFANTGSKQARFGNSQRPNTAASITSRIDQFGSKRWELDGNYGLKNIAFRFVALDEDQNYRRLYI